MASGDSLCCADDCARLCAARPACRADHTRECGGVDCSSRTAGARGWRIRSQSSSERAHRSLARSCRLVGRSVHCDCVAEKARPRSAESCDGAVLNPCVARLRRRCFIGSRECKSANRDTARSLWHRLRRNCVGQGCCSHCARNFGRTSAPSIDKWLGSSRRKGCAAVLVLRAPRACIHGSCVWSRRRTRSQ